MSRTALVHPSTSKLGPDEQAQGVYVYTPPEVTAFRNGEPLDDGSLQVVRAFYAELGQPLPTQPALAEPFYSNKGGGTDTTAVTRSVGMAPELAAPYGKKVVRKPSKSPEPTPYDVMEHIVATALSTYTDGQKDALFNHLAAELGYIVE